MITVTIKIDDSHSAVKAWMRMLGEEHATILEELEANVQYDMISNIQEHDRPVPIVQGMHWSIDVVKDDEPFYTRRIA